MARSYGIHGAKPKHGHLVAQEEGSGDCMGKQENKDLNKGKSSKLNGKSRDDHSPRPELHIIRNDENVFDPEEPTVKPVRTKLTRDELLAGHSSFEEAHPGPDASNSITDPRFKSPDEFLFRTAP